MSSTDYTDELFPEGSKYFKVLKQLEQLENMSNREFEVMFNGNKPYTKTSAKGRKSYHDTEGKRVSKKVYEELIK